MRTKHLLLSAFFIMAALLVSPRVSSAQFVNGNVYLGPHFAFSPYGGSISLGVNLEVPITRPGSAGPGRIALAARGDIAFGYFDANVIFFSALANYHYSVAEEKVDLFGGIGLGIFSISYLGTTNFFPSMDLGVRYFISSGMALRGMIGLLNYPWFTAGIDWAL